MRIAVVYSRGLAGLDAPLVRVEAHLAGGLTQFRIVGLPDTEVEEARDRVRAALNTSRFEARFVPSNSARARCAPRITPDRPWPWQEAARRPAPAASEGRR
jgi:hypothetical protein